MDPELRARHTFDEGETIRVSEAVRRACIFSRHELTVDAPMARMDLIVCQRVFDASPKAHGAQLLDGFHFSLREGGLLLVADHIESFPEERFERIGEGQRRARARGARARCSSREDFRDDLSEAVALAVQTIVGIDRRLARGREALRSSGAGAPGISTDLAQFVHSLGHPLVLCDPELRVLYLSREAREAFGLSESARGAQLAVISAQLPGGHELVSAARRVLAGQGRQDLTVRSARHVYLARLCAAGEEPGARSVSILFTDVTQFEAAAASAIEQQDRHAALVRLARLSCSPGDSSAVHEEALAALFAIIPGCSSGVIMALASGTAELEVLASRGLGADPLSALRGIGAGDLLALAVELGTAVSRRAVPSAPEIAAHPAVRRQVADDPAVRGLASPLLGAGALLGVVAVFGQDGGDNPVDRDFMASVASVISNTMVRARARRRLALQLEASALLAGAATLRAAIAGLLHALRPLHVDDIEIGAAVSDASDHWVPLYSDRVGADRDPPWTVPDPNHSPVFISTLSGGELLVTADRRQGGRYLLRLRGDNLRAPDPELASGLRFVARLLADFIDRSPATDRSGWRSTPGRARAARSPAVPLTVRGRAGTRTRR
jgi:PAS domain-containing protein